MSKNPAWEVFSEKVRKINQDYEEKIDPLRERLGRELAQAEAEYREKVLPLTVERDRVVKTLKDAFGIAVDKAVEERKDSMRVAHDVKNAEVKRVREAEKVVA